ncbi:translation initiation factor eIF4G [Saccharomycopsis crataegensis]|uniref:Translation initiation factor eIF4G n=1 Tax=Saccharomycopsis crataegensis TaxID=43959 RepID=A0AAV5QG64_9ASCO|nr:translation initiation factor eIF4G [Saccharomycopsis crataegensis]
MPTNPTGSSHSGSNHSNPNNSSGGSNNNGGAGNRRSSTTNRQQFDYGQPMNNYMFNQQAFANANMGYMNNGVGAPFQVYAPYYQGYSGDYSAGYNMPFPNQNMRQGSFSGYYPNQGQNYGHNQNKHLKNQGSANSSPVSHKNNLHYNNNHNHHSHHAHHNNNNGNNTNALVSGTGNTSSVSSPATSNASLSTNPKAPNTPSKPAHATLNSPLVATAGSIPASTGKVTIKNPKGQDVDLSSLANKSQPSSRISTPKAANNAKLASVSSPSGSASDAVRDDFRLKVAALAKAKADAVAKAKAEAEANSKETVTEEKQEKVLNKESSNEAEAEEAKPVEENVVENVVEKEDEKEVEKEDEKEAEKEVEKEKNVETSEKSENAPSTESSKPEVDETNVEPVPVVESKEETKPEAVEIKEESTKESESQESEESPNVKDVFNLSELLEAISKAKPIEDPYSFKYPDDWAIPDERCHEHFKKTGKPKYDPRFLLQFKEPLNLEVDPQWKEKHAHLFSVVEMNSRSGSMRNSSNFRGAPGQFGLGSNIGNSRGIGGNMRSQSNNPRKGFGGDSKSGSRQSSRRRGGSNAGTGSRRDGRSDSKRNNSKRYKDKENEVNQVLENIENQIKDNEKPAEPVKPLEKSANRWVPRSLKKKTGEVKKNADGSEFLNEEEINRKTKSLLNKLTLEMFENITAEIIKIAEQSKFEEDGKSLKQVLELTFHKACDEPHWSSMYAQLCAKMVKDFSLEVKDTTSIDKTGAPLVGGQLVRKCLLTRCQVEFEKGWADKLPTNPDGSALEPEMMSDEYYAAAAAKRRGLGLVRFIGELYALGLLSDQVIVSCMHSLSSNFEDPSEETLETLSQLITTVGPIIDLSNKPGDNRARMMLAKAFERIGVIINLKIPARIKFKLMDLLDARSSNWSEWSKSKGPTTIAQIHADAEKQREDEKRRNEKKMSKGGKSYGGDSRQNSNSNWAQSTVSRNDMKNIGVVRNSSDKALGPINNFAKRGARHSSNNLAAVNSRENSTRSVSNSIASIGSSANLAANESKSNLFDVLNHEESDEENGSDEEEENGENDNGEEAESQAADVDEESKEEKD